MHTFIHTYTQTYVHSRTHVHVAHKHTCTYIHVNVHSCSHIHTFIHTCIRTHIHAFCRAGLQYKGLLQLMLQAQPTLRPGQAPLLPPHLPRPLPPGRELEERASALPGPLCGPRGGSEEAAHCRRYGGGGNRGMRGSGRCG